MPLLVLWAATSCTLTTDLDFVGPPLDSRDNESVVEASTHDASAHDGSAHLIDADVSLTPAVDAAQSSSEATSPSSVDSDTAHVDSDQDASRLDASTLDASPLDASTVEASILDAAMDAMQDATPADCVAATTLLAESYEGDLTQWSGVNWQSTQCQQTDIATDIAVDSAHSIRSRIECASESDHLHFTSLQLLSDNDEPAQTGMYAPYGFVLVFSVWLSVGYDFEADTWLDFVRFTGFCDREDAPLAIGLNDPGRHLSITNATTLDELSEPVIAAPRFPLATWTAVTVYVNYDQGSLAVWQDGALVTQATFESDASSLCHVEFGTMASRTNTDLVTFQDDVRLARLDAPLPYASVAARICAD